MEIKENGKMKAVVYSSYGSPEVLELKEVQKPTPTDDQVLIKVCASSINVEDLDYLKGSAWAVRMLGLFRPKYKILGFDVAGKIEQVGRNITNFKAGDEVMGDLFGCGLGAFAQYVCAPEKALTLKPSNMTFKEAAAVPSRAILAIQGLRSKRPVTPNQKVLINGAGGGVGPFAVQIAKHLGAQVTAVDSASKLEFLRSIGADYVIDYTKEDFTKNGQKYDLIVDVAGYHSILGYRRALTSTGIYSIVGGSRSTIFQVVFLGYLISLFGKKKFGLMAWKPNKKEDINYVLDLISSGKIAPLIDRCYPLEDIVEVFIILKLDNPGEKS